MTAEEARRTHRQAASTQGKGTSAPNGAVLGNTIVHGVGPQALASGRGGLGGVLLRDGGVKPEAWGGIGGTTAREPLHGIQTPQSLCVKPPCSVREAGQLIWGRWLADVLHSLTVLLQDFALLRVKDEEGGAEATDLVLGNARSLQVAQVGGGDSWIPAATKGASTEKRVAETLSTHVDQPVAGAHNLGGVGGCHMADGVGGNLCRKVGPWAILATAGERLLTCRC